MLYLISVTHLTIKLCDSQGHQVDPPGSAVVPGYSGRAALYQKVQRCQPSLRSGTNGSLAKEALCQFCSSKRRRESGQRRSG